MRPIQNLFFACDRAWECQRCVATDIGDMLYVLSSASSFLPLRRDVGAGEQK